MKLIKFKEGNEEAVFVNPAMVTFVRNYISPFCPAEKEFTEIVFRGMPTKEDEELANYDSVVVQEKLISVVRKLEGA